ncbi:MAG: ribbon-helix-helix protein, CopG family [Candidatus Dormibacteria bacterium]
MVKTKVYLPSGLKHDLSRLASSTGRSEAELIREAVAARVRASSRTRPHGSLFRSGDPNLSGRVDEALAGFGGV